MISGPWIEEKLAPASFATAWAMSVLPVPGGPYRRTPFGGSMPRRSNSSACFSGSSIISRTFMSSSFRPPMSSYVTVGVRTSPSRTGSSFISIIVSSWLWTIPFGAVLMTMNGRAPPMSAMPGTMTTSPLFSGRFRRPRFTKFSIPWPKEILWPSLMIGAIVMRSAGRTSAFRTSTLSPRLTPTFRRTRPSIRMMLFPSSSCITRNNFAAVDFFPMIWMISPTATPSATRVFVSTRARPKPTSDWGASATLRTIRSGTPVRTPPAYIKVVGRSSRSDKVEKSRDGPTLADLARGVHDELLRLDDVDAAVGPDADLVSLDERRRRRLELNLLPFDSVCGQLPADPEKASGGLDADFLRLDRGNLRRSLEVDLDFFGLQSTVDANGSAQSKFLGLNPA